MSLAPAASMLRGRGQIFVFEEGLQQFASAVAESDERTPCEKQDKQQPERQSAVACPRPRAETFPRPEEEYEADKQRKDEAKQATGQRGQGDKCEAGKEP